MFPYSLISVSSIRLLIFLKNWKKNFIGKIKNKSKKSDIVTKLEEINELENITILDNSYKTSNFQSTSDDLTNFSKPSNKKLNCFILNSAYSKMQVRTVLSKNKESSNIIISKNARTCKSKNSIRRKAIILVQMIVLLFLIQWIPLWILQFLIEFSDKSFQQTHKINLITTVLSYSNTVSNPVLYMFLTDNFKKFFRKILRKK